MSHKGSFVQRPPAKQLQPLLQAQSGDYLRNGLITPAICPQQFPQCCCHSISVRKLMALERRADTFRFSGYGDASHPLQFLPFACCQPLQHLPLIQTTEIPTPQRNPGKCQCSILIEVHV